MLTEWGQMLAKVAKHYPKRLKKAKDYLRRRKC